MTNLIFFIAGLISYKLIRHITILVPLYLTKKQLRNKWVRANLNENNLIYNRKLVK
jgi:hypothetical protein